VNGNLESWWSDWKPVASKTLQRGEDFDVVVLATSLGTLPYLCKELIAGDATQAWKNMCDNLQAIKTQGFQLWATRDMASFGWARPRGIFCGYVEPFDTWSDMSPLLPLEGWLPSLVGEGFVVFGGAGEEEAVGEGGVALFDGGDDVGAAEPVGFGEVGGGPLGGVVGVGVVEAYDVEAGFAGLALGGD
jgi:hypothetical protein